MFQKVITLLYIFYGIFFTFIVYYSYYNDYLFYLSFIRIVFGLCVLLFAINLILGIKKYSQTKKLKTLKNSIIGVFFLLLITSIYFIQNKINTDGNLLLAAETSVFNTKYYIAIGFKDNSEYVIVENSLESYGNSYYRGKYTISDSVFTLDKIQGQILKSNRFKIISDTISENGIKIENTAYLIELVNDKNSFEAIDFNIIVNNLKK